MTTTRHYHRLAQLAGKCPQYCGRDRAAGRSMCDVCLSLFADRVRDRAREVSGSGATTARCGRCGLPGHYRNRCAREAGEVAS